MGVGVGRLRAVELREPRPLPPQLLLQSLPTGDRSPVGAAAVAKATRRRVNRWALDPLGVTGWVRDGHGNSVLDTVP